GGRGGDRRGRVGAASGDVGAVGEPCKLVKGLTGGAFPPVKEVSLPASDPLVLGAGGTTLTAARSTGAYVDERAWGLPFGDPGTQFQGSGAGFSPDSARPGRRRGGPAPRGGAPAWPPPPLPTAWR